MARDLPWKRKSDAIDLTHSDESGGDSRPPKLSRVASSSGLSNISNGQRFGQDTEFIPLSQLSQSAADEDDAQAADLIQGSQDLDDASFNNYALYGMSNLMNIIKYLLGRI